MTKTSLKSFYDLVHYTDEDGYEHLLPFGFVSESLKTIDHAGNAIHNGKAFAAWGLKEHVATDGSYDIVLRTPAGSTAYIHVLKAYSWVEGGQCRLQVYETPTTSTSDTSFTPINRNRLSTVEATVTVETSATVTLGAATQINEKVFGGGTDKKGDTGGGDGPGRAEYILDTSTVYIFRALNKSTDSATVSIWVLWGEEDKGIET